MEYLLEWFVSVSGSDWKWYAKILAGNDTLLTKSHQAGLYVPKPVIFDLFPNVARSAEVNPRQTFPVEIDSHRESASVTAIWYNNKTRNETRITGWGGKKSPLLDPDSTGSLCIFAFHFSAKKTVDLCKVWLCAGVEEEDFVIDRIGAIEPGEGAYIDPATLKRQRVEPLPKDFSCRLAPNEIPVEWKFTFPEAAAVVAKSIDNLPSAKSLSADKRLLKRRECEFEIFRSIEVIVVLPRVREGFSTVDLFVNYANVVTNRRKSRSGASLELQAKAIFQEENLTHSHDEISEERKRPDFLFPSAEAYRDPAFPTERLQMLAVKTTCKDRWRQIINEADRIERKYLLTLQEGVSPHQFAEMKAANVSLVVPGPIQAKYVDALKPELLTLQDFIRMTREKCAMH